MFESTAGVPRLEVLQLENREREARQVRRASRSTVMVPALVTAAFVTTSFVCLGLLPLDGAAPVVGLAAFVPGVIGCIVTFIALGQAKSVRPALPHEGVIVFFCAAWLVFGIARTLGLAIVRALCTI